MGDESAIGVCLLVVTGKDGSTVLLLLVDTGAMLDIVLVVADDTTVGACAYAERGKVEQFQ